MATTDGSGRRTCWPAQARGRAERVPAWAKTLDPVVSDLWSSLLTLGPCRHFAGQRLDVADAVPAQALARTRAGKKTQKVAGGRRFADPVPSRPRLNPILLL